MLKLAQLHFSSWFSLNVAVLLISTARDTSSAAFIGIAPRLLSGSAVGSKGDSKPPGLTRLYFLQTSFAHM